MALHGGVFMANYVVLWNPHAGNGRAKTHLEKLKVFLTEACVTVCDMTRLESYADFFASLDADDQLVILGGDGTLNRFVNDTVGLEIRHPIYYYAAGSGNDFLRDIPHEEGKPVEVTAYLQNLPTVEVDGKTYHFLNGVGYGIDGYCCEVGDQQRAQGNQKINYTSIAIKGLLFYYHPKNATVTVDGETHTFQKAWLAPTMHGRYYGGGMMPTPDQDRTAQDPYLSTMVFYGSGKMKTLMIFPNLFKGEHIKFEKHVKVLRGKEITVEFDRPTALQIDGETILGVTKYTARVAQKAAKAQEELAAAQA
jgi:diacylglycerol kinase family enzyme